MSSVTPSVLSVCSFDGRKLLVIMIIIAITLTIESQIGIISDFIPEQLASNEGIAAFIGIWAVFIATQYYILAFVKHYNNTSRARTPFLHLIHKIVIAAQFLLARLGSRVSRPLSIIMATVSTCGRHTVTEGPRPFDPEWR